MDILYIYIIFNTSKDRKTGIDRETKILMMDKDRERQRYSCLHSIYVYKLNLCVVLIPPNPLQNYVSHVRKKAFARCCEKIRVESES